MPEIHPIPRRAPRVRRPLLAGVLAGVLGLALLAQPALAAVHADGAAAGTDGISGGPDDDRTHLSYQMAPGQRLDDVYVVRNTGTTQQDVTLFATDAFNTDDGQYALLDTKIKPTAVGTWVLFNGADTAEHLSLAPGETKQVPFTVTTPANAGPGDHAGGIVISSQKGSGRILVDRRVATRLYVRVPGKLQPQLTVSSMHAVYNPTLNPFAGSTTISFTVTNNGNVALSGHLVAGADAVFGIPVGQLRKDVPEMLPGSTRSITIDVPGVPQVGYLNAHVDLQPYVEKDAMNPGPLHAVSRATPIAAIPWWILVLLLLIGGYVVFRRYRRRSDAKRAAAWIEYTEAEAKRKAESGTTADDAADATEDATSVAAQPAGTDATRANERA
ncbi:WxL protein peptidoglycan domain-containing protein [Leifsonia shinshuensis]|uniref:Dihydroorotate dehydrogenase (Fumarate) n=1 Tax=Leifsonia shinshuensis TaxID=150026 RepID=A0A853CPP0_9MICO|nr:dihydroorotate dehydrogenase (fumarate) [Leifsonia shinshuensis]